MQPLQLNVSKFNGKNVLFSLAFLTAFFANYTSLTMLVYKIPGSVYLFLKILSISLIVLKIILYDKFKYKEMYLYLFIFIILLFNWYITGFQDFLLLFFLCVGAKNIDKKYFLKLSFISLIIGLILTILFSKFGIIENLLFYRRTPSGLVERESLGTIYPTVLGSIVFFLVMQMVYLREKNNIFDISIIFISAFLVEKITDNRLVFILLSAFGICIIILSIFKLNHLKLKTGIKFIWASIVVLIPIVFVWLCLNFDQSIRWMTELNILLSQRLRLSWEGFVNYPITFFGQQISQNGWGGGKGLAYGVKYFYLDSLPVSLLIMRGATFFIGYLVYNFMFLKKAIERKDMKLAVILTCIVAYDLVDDKSLCLSLNPFILLSMNFFLYSNEEKNFNKEKV